MTELRRLQLTINTELHAITAAVAETQGMSFNRFVEERLKRDPLIKKAIAESGIKIPERRPRGQPRKHPPEQS